MGGGNSSKRLPTKKKTSIDDEMRREASRRNLGSFINGSQHDNEDLDD